MPNMPAMVNLRNLSPTWMFRNLYAASVPAKAAKLGPVTAPRVVAQTMIDR